MGPSLDKYGKIPHAAPKEDIQVIQEKVLITITMDLVLP